jgi:hypothetical protein
VYVTISMSLAHFLVYVRFKTVKRQLTGVESFIGFARALFKDDNLRNMFKVNVIVFIDSLSEARGTYYNTFMYSHC